MIKLDFVNIKELEELIKSAETVGFSGNNVSNIKARIFENPILSKPWESLSIGMKIKRRKLISPELFMLSNLIDEIINLNWFLTKVDYPMKKEIRHISIDLVKYINSSILPFDYRGEKASIFFDRLAEVDFPPYNKTLNLFFQRIANLFNFLVNNFSDFLVETEVNQPQSSNIISGYEYRIIKQLIHLKRNYEMEIKYEHLNPIEMQMQRIINLNLQFTSSFDRCPMIIRRNHQWNSKLNLIFDKLNYLNLLQYTFYYAKKNELAIWDNKSNIREFHSQISESEKIKKDYWGLQLIKLLEYNEVSFYYGKPESIIQLENNEIEFSRQAIVTNTLELVTLIEDFNNILENDKNLIEFNKTLNPFIYKLSYISLVFELEQILTVPNIEDYAAIRKDLKSLNSDLRCLFSVIDFSDGYAIRKNIGFLLSLENSSIQEKSFDNAKLHYSRLKLYAKIFPLHRQYAASRTFDNLSLQLNC